MVERSASLLRQRKLSRLLATWLAYRTNWMWCSIVLIVAMVFGFIAWLLPVPDNKSLLSATPQGDYPQPAVSLLPLGNEAGIKWSEVRSLSIFALNQYKTLFTPNAIPRLESLICHGRISDDQLADLCKVHRQLKSLTLYDVGGLTKTGWQSLEQLDQLTFLKIHGISRFRNIEPLAWPPHLQTLACDDERGISLLRLKELQQLRELNCLETRLVFIKEQDSVDSINLLRTFPQLRRLYLTRLPKEFLDSSFVQSKLPYIRVHPSAYEPVRGQRAATVLAAGIAVLFLLMIQSTSLFASSNSVVTPGFARWNLGPVIVVVMAQVTSSFVVLQLANCAMISSIALTLVPLVVLSLIGRIAPMVFGFGRTQPASFQFPNLMGQLSVAFIAVATIPIIMIGVGSEFDYFLAGHPGAIGWLLLLAAPWCAVDLIRRHTRLYRDLEAAGMVDRSCSQRMAIDQFCPNDVPGQKASFVYRRSDRLIEKVLFKRKAGMPVTSRELWQLGFAFRPSDMFVFQVAAIAVVGLMFYLLGSRVGWLDASGMKVKSLLVPITLQAIIFGLVMPILAGFQRLPYAALELPRPISRGDWISSWFSGILDEFKATLWVTVLFSVSIGSVVLDDWLHLGFIVVAAVGATASVYTFAMLMLSFRPGWWMAFPGVFLGVVMSVCFGLATYFSDKETQWARPELLSLGVAAIYAFAGASYWLARQRWRRVEVGMIS